MAREAMTAIYAGSFDPVTLGHMDVMRRASGLFDRVVVAIGVHPTRKPLFNTEERIGFLKQVTAPYDNVSVTSFEGLLINFCQKSGAHVLVRGLRHLMDFSYELQIAQANKDMAPDVETVFLPTSPQFGFITASLVREIASHGGDVSRYVAPVVREALLSKYAD